MNDPKLTIVIVNYRTPDLTIACLRSVSHELGAPLDTRAVVVDNGSADGSIERITDTIQVEGWTGWASVVALDANGGYAIANNAAIRAALQSSHAPDYFWLLNSDTV